MLQLASIFFGLSQIALILLLLVKAGRKRPAEWIFALLTLCVASDLLLQLSRSLSLAPFYINWLLSFFQTAVAGMFWLLCYTLFDDHCRLKIWQMALVFMMSLLPLCANIYGAFGAPPEIAYILLARLPQMLELVLVGHGLSIIIRNWKIDLIPLRRRIGQSLVLFAGIFICLIISTRYVFNMYLPWMVDVQYILLGLFLLYFNVQLLSWQKLPLFGYSAGNSDPISGRSNEAAVATMDSVAQDEVDDESTQALVLQLRQLMEEEKIYRKNGLTINEVAKQMLMPEYRLRSLINGELGYRNFSDFIGRYRIEEAAQHLADPGEKRLPVLSIALGVGYRSLSSFNKSFKETYQLTPSEYRRKQLGKH